jgi:hypothetical protein
MPSILRFPANQEKDPDDLPESAEEAFTPPPELVEQPNPPSGTKAIRRSSATIVPEASFDEPTRPSDHPGPDLDEFPWFETTASSAAPPADDIQDELVDPSADTAALPNMETGEVEPPRTTLPLLLAASAVMILLAGTAVMLVLAMLQEPEPAQAATKPMVPTMVAPAAALPAPTIAAPEPVEEAPAPAPVKRTKKKKTASIEDVEPTQVTVTTPAIEAPAEPAPAAEAPPPAEAEKTKKGLFGKKKDR